MSYPELLTAHREVNTLLGKLALGMGKEELNRRVVELSESWFGERKASILRLDSESGRLFMEYAPSLPLSYSQAIEGIEIGANVGSCGAAAFSKQTVVVEDTYSHPNWAPYVSLAKQAGLRACWSVPIMSSEQDVMGTFAIYSSTPSAPALHELEVLNMLASLYAVAWEKYQLEDQLYYHARYDALTQCLNRSGMYEQAKDCLNTDRKYVACFFADIDQFKLINDRFGHEVGDQVLRSVGQRLHRIFTGSCLKGRYGGDEFVVFSFSNDESDFHRFEEECNRQLSRRLVQEGLEIKVSVGKAISEVTKLSSLEELIKLADKEMYKIKHRRRHDRDQGIIESSY